MRNAWRRDLLTLPRRHPKHTSIVEINTPYCACTAAVSRMLCSEKNARDKARMLELRMKMKLTADEALELRRLSARTRKRLSRERMRQVVSRSEQPDVSDEYRERLYAIYDRDVDQATARMRIDYATEVMALLITNPRYLETLDFATVHRYLRRKYYKIVVSRLGNTVYWKGDDGSGCGRGKRRMEQGIEALLTDIRVIRLPKQQPCEGQQQTSSRYSRFLEAPVAVDWGTDTFPSRRHQTCCESMLRFWRQFEALVLKHLATHGYPSDTNARVLSDEAVQSMPVQNKWEQMWLNAWRIMSYSDYFWLKNILFLSLKQDGAVDATATVPTDSAGGVCAEEDGLAVSRDTLYSTLKLLRNRLRCRMYRNRHSPRGRPSSRWLQAVAEDAKLESAIQNPVARVTEMDESGQAGGTRMVPMKRKKGEVPLATDDSEEDEPYPPLPNTTLVSYSSLDIRTALDPALEASQMDSCDGSLPFSVSSGSPVNSDEEDEHEPLQSFVSHMTTTRPAAAAATMSAATSAFIAAQATARPRRAHAATINNAPIVADDLPFPAYR